MGSTILNGAGPTVPAASGTGSNTSRPFTPKLTRPVRPENSNSSLAGRLPPAPGPVASSANGRFNSAPSSRGARSSRAFNSGIETGTSPSCPNCRAIRPSEPRTNHTTHTPRGSPTPVSIQGAGCWTSYCADEPGIGLTRSVVADRSMPPGAGTPLQL
ncbi:type I secretion target domain-containing protein [Streptomyces sp. OM5714]|nr:type I secretion target domain-containing protein [Streptomyces sp. OM5714]